MEGGSGGVGPNGRKVAGRRILSWLRRVEGVIIIRGGWGGLVAEAMTSVHHNLGSRVIILPILDALAFILTSTGLAKRDRRSRTRRRRKTAELYHTCNPDRSRAQAPDRIPTDLPVGFLLNIHHCCSFFANT